jgi:FKBP-type peptidyl-prolyl cis-trans isomerase
VQAHSTATAKQGDFVSVDYTGTLDDGTVFDTSRKPGRTPLEFVVGGGMVRHTPLTHLQWLQHHAALSGC